MVEETNDVRRRSGEGARLDDVDRRLLALLAEDATRSYAELGRLLNLSPPAVHERAKRLRRERVITGTVARLDGGKIGRPLLAFVHVDTMGWGKSARMLQLADLPEVEELHSVTGETSVLLKVRTAGTLELERLLERIYGIEGVRGTRSFIVLSTYLERGPMPA
jgi:Lrp/AsnC family leucine-responsive transcriptional regulator